MERIKLLALILCLAASVPQLMAQTYTVAGNDTQALGASWSPSTTSNDMTHYSGNKYYLLKTVTYSSNTEYEYKITVNHGWTTSYGDNGGSGNAKYSVNAGTGFVCYTFDSSSHVPHVVSSLQTVVIAGDDTQALGSLTWNGSVTANSMTTTDGITYTMTKSVDYTSSGNKQCKAVVANTDWYGNSSGGNVSYNIPAAGSYTVTYTFNAVTGIVSVDPQSEAPVTPTYYITGDNGLGLGGFKYNPTTTMTDEGNGIYTYSYNVTTAGNYYFAFGDGQGSDWNDFNGNHRFGPTSGNEEVSLDGSWVNTQKGGGSYFVNVDAGPVTITLDVTNMRFNVVGTAPSAPVDYYVVGENTSIFPNGWNTGSETLMTENNGTYTWTASNVHLAKGTTYQFKVHGSDDSWHPSGNNATFTVDDSGTYNVVFTFDGTNVTAVPSLIQADPVYTYDIYVRYTGYENVNNVFLYAWDSEGNLSDAWNGSTGGTALSSLTTQEINGYTYYKMSYTSYDSSIGVIFNENGSSSTQTANLTAQPGDNYFTYGGGNTVAGPNSEADAAMAYYVVGEDTSIFPNGWDLGDGTVMTDNGDGTYSWTSSQVHLTQSVDYAYKARDNQGNWYPSGDNQTFDVNVPGTYTVNVTYDSNTGDLTATTTLIAADPINAVYVIGNAGTQQWAANAGIAMEYDSETGYYKLENVVLTANSYFALATVLGSDSEDWATLNANRLSSTGSWNWALTDEHLGQWLSTQDYQDDNHNWYVEKSGAYDIFFNPNTRQVMISKSNANLYISYGVNWNYDDNSVEMTSVDGNIYQTTITLTQGDYFLFSTALSDETALGATSQGYEITDLMIGFAQKLQNEEPNTNNFHFTGTTGKYIVVVNMEKMTVTLRKTADATVTKIFLQKTPNVTLDPAGGTYNGQTLEGKRGGIYAWNKLNLKDAEATYSTGPDGPTNYTYEGELYIDNNPYSGNSYLKDLKDTTTVDGKQWYAWSVSNSICEFYFIRSNKTDLKSQKIMRRSGEVWLIWKDEDATEDRQDDYQHNDKLQDVSALYYDVTASGVSDGATMLEDHYYVYYTNTTGWDSVYCYAWYEGNPVIEFTGAYPGKKCTFVGYDEDGYEVWCYDFGLMEDFHRIWGEDENGEYVIPSNVIFDNGLNEDHTRQQTGDLPFDNGACYDYLGMVYLGNSLNGIINSGIVNGPKYTVEDNLIGVYYDESAITKIIETDQAGNPILDNQGQPRYIPVKGALYAKDFENYSSKSVRPNGTTDYVYETCAHPKTATYPGGSQIQIKREYYDQSNWVKIVLSPNFDNNHLQNTDVTYDKDLFDDLDFEGATGGDGNYLEQYVGKVIPGGSMSGNLVNNINPEMHITNIALPLPATAYEPNVYVTSHFNDSVVFSYVHQDWSPGIYNGVYRTVPVWKTNEETGETFVDHMKIDSNPTKMYYVAPKPQEVAFITWAVFVHPDPDGNIGTRDCESEPTEPGEFHAPMNWDRTGQLWDGTNPNDTTDGAVPYGTTYGPYSNGYMQHAAFQVNWSLFEGMECTDPYARPQLPWYKIFKPGQAYKILAVIRYAHGDKPDEIEYEPGVYKDNDYDDEIEQHIANAPRRGDGDAEAVDNNWPDMQGTPYKDLGSSKFIVFPLRGSSKDSDGDGVGNVTAVEEIKYVHTDKDIVSVRYYDLTGRASEQAFDGINIVVTTYSDGSRTSRKIMR